MNARKGFVFSLIAISFMMLLILMAVTMANEYRENERVAAEPVPNSFAAASLDNVGNLVAGLLLPSASITRDDNGTVISVSDSLPRQMDASQLSDLRYYAEGQLAGLQHANISVNTTRVENGSLDVRMMDNFVFQSMMNMSPAMVFRGMANGSSTNATNYTVTILVYDYNSGITEFSNDPGGTVNVTVRYSDINASLEKSYSLNPSAANHFVINYVSGGKADIVIGRVAQDGSYYDDALWMNLTNETGSYSFSAQLPPRPANASGLIVFPVQMSYTQDGVRKAANASR